MSKLRLVSISALGKSTEIKEGQEIEKLIAAGEKLKKKKPDTQFGIVNEEGYFLWPENPKQEGFVINTPDTAILTLPQSCIECPVENCRLPYSKTLPNRIMSMFTYSRHPACDLSVKSNSKKVM